MRPNVATCAAVLTAAIGYALGCAVCEVAIPVLFPPTRRAPLWAIPGAAVQHNCGKATIVRMTDGKIELDSGAVCDPIEVVPIK